MVDEQISVDVNVTNDIPVDVSINNTTSLEVSISDSTPVAVSISNEQPVNVEVIKEVPIDVSIGTGVSAPLSFITLTDTPTSYAGQQGKSVVVNATEDGLEFSTGGSGSDEKVKYNASDVSAGYLADKTIAGVGITLSENTDKLEITNSAPDQVVSITDSGIAVVTGTYPNFNIDVPATDLSSYVPYTGATAHINLDSKYFIDDNGYISVFPNQRYLADQTNKIVFDWANKTINSTDNFVSIDWENHLLKENNSSKFDWENMKFPTLTTNGILKVSNSDGTIGVDTSTYLTTETDPIFSTWLSSTPPLYSFTESDPLSLHLDQTTPQTISNGQPVQATLTASEIVATDANKKLQSLSATTYPSLTELSYVKGVTSQIQTQFATYAKLDGTNQPFTGSLEIEVPTAVEKDFLINLTAEDSAGFFEVANSGTNWIKMGGSASSGFGVYSGVELNLSGTNGIYLNNNVNTDIVISKASPVLTLNSSTGTKVLKFSKVDALSEAKAISTNTRKVDGGATSNTTGISASNITGGSINYNTGTWSVSFWAYPSSTTDDQFAFRLMDTSNQQIHFAFKSGYAVADLSNLSSGIRSKRGAKWSGSWKHIVITSTGSTLKLYINNVEQTDSTLTGSVGWGDDGQKMVIGSITNRVGDRDTYKWGGRIDQFAYWEGKELNSTERGYLYNSGVGIYHTNTNWPSSTTQGWEFDEGTGTTASAWVSANNITLNSAGWTTGLISPVTAQADYTFIDIIDGVNANETQQITWGNTSSSLYGTAHIFEGLTHQSNILGIGKSYINGTKSVFGNTTTSVLSAGQVFGTGNTQTAGVVGSTGGVIFGKSNSDAKGSQVLLGVSNSIANTSGTDTASTVVVGISNTASGQRSGNFGVSNTASGGLNNTWLFGYGNSATGSQTIVIGNNITSVPANQFRWGHDNNNYLNFTTAGVFTQLLGGATVLTSNSTGLGIGTSPSAKLHSLATTEQLRIGYNSTNYKSEIVDSAGGVDYYAVGTTPEHRFKNDFYFVGSGTGLPYGGAYGNEIAWTQTNAAQDTWYLVSDTDMSDMPLNLVTHDGSGKLTVTKAGTYHVVFTASVECSALNKHIQLGVSINGASPVYPINHFEITTTNAQIEVSGNGIITLAANDTIEVAMRTTDTGTPDLSVDHLNITLIQVGG